MKDKSSTLCTLDSEEGEIALVVAKGGIDVGAASPVILPMVGTMTIITTPHSYLHMLSNMDGNLQKDL